MQLMKQNGIQVNNNNNSAESRVQLTERLTALQCPRSVAGGGESQKHTQSWVVTDYM